MDTDADTDDGTEVVFYWRPGCSYCWRLRRDLRRANVEVTERNIWDDQAAAAFVRSVANGNETVPTVVVAGTALVNPSVHQVVARLGGGRLQRSSAPPQPSWWARLRHRGRVG